MTRAAIYIRVSTDRQAKEGDSLAAQRDALRRYVDEREDWCLAGEYMDDGISGQKFMERDGLQTMLSDCREGKVDVVLFTKLDRFFRSLRHFTAVHDELMQLGIRWTAIWEPMYDTSSPAGELVINQMMSFAQFEAKNTGQRIRQVFSYKNANGEWTAGNPPIGYRVEDGHLVPSDAAPAVRECFAIFAQEGSLASMSRRFSDVEGFPRTYHGVKVMLRNRHYIGEHGGKPGFCPPLVSEELFEDVQRKIGMNIRAVAKRTYIFSGLLHCGECGARLAGMEPRPGRSYVYRCRKHYTTANRMCGNKRTVNEKKLEEYLVSNLIGEARLYLAKCEEAATEVVDYSQKIANAKARLSRLQDLYIDGMIDKATFAKKKEAIDTELQELEERSVPKAVDTSAVEAFVSGWSRESYQTLSPEERRLFWRSVLKRVLLHEDKSITLEFL